MNAHSPATAIAQSRRRRISETTSVFALITVALLARMLLFMYVFPRPQKLYTPDSFSYDQIALNLLHFGVFSSQSQLPLTPDLKRTPGYPLLMAAVYAFAGHSPEVVVLVQFLLAAATVVLVYLLGQGLGLSHRGSVLAAAALTLEPVFAMTSLLLLSETLFAFFVVLALLALVRWRRGELLWLVVAALSLGLASLTRPIAQFLPLTLVPVLVLGFQGRKARSSLAILMFLGLSLGTTYSWAYQNYRASGQFALSNVADVNLLYYRAREVLADTKGISQEAALLELQARVPKGGVPMERTIAERAEALEVLLRHPAETLSMVGKGAARIFLDPGFTPVCTLLDPANSSMECLPGEASMNEPGAVGNALHLLGEFNPLQLAVLGWSTGLSLLLYAASFAGVAILIRGQQWYTLALLLTVVAYFTLLSAGAEANGRFRIPVLPAIAVLGAVAAEPLLQRRAGQQGAVTARL